MLYNDFKLERNGIFMAMNDISNLNVIVCPWQWKAAIKTNYNGFLKINATNPLINHQNKNPFFLFRETHAISSQPILSSLLPP